MKWILWVLEIVAGSAIFALGFDLFLEPYDINCGGLSGVVMIVVHLLDWGSVGILTLILNIPLFLLGWRSIGRKFFFGSLIGAISLSGFMELFEFLPAISTQTILASVYGGVVCGVGVGLVFFARASTGGTDIIVRLLKKRWKNIPIGRILMGIDGAVALLTGLAFWDFSNILYCGITLFICSKLVDAVVYNFDYSQVALIVSEKYEAVAEAIGKKLDRGSTYLYGQGVYSGKDTKVVLAAVKRQQLSDLKDLVISIDPDAFIILQDSHQVLGDGFVRYSDDSL